MPIHCAGLFSSIMFKPQSKLSIKILLLKCKVPWGFVGIIITWHAHTFTAHIVVCSDLDKVKQLIS